MVLARLVRRGMLGSGAACRRRQAAWRQVAEQTRWRPAGGNGWAQTGQGIVTATLRNGVIDSSLPPGTAGSVQWGRYDGAGQLLVLFMALTEAIRLALEEQDLRMVGEAIEQRRRERGIAEDLNPPREVEICRDQQAASLVPLGAELEQERPTRSQAEIAQLVQDDEVDALPALQVAGQAVLLLGGEQLLGQADRRGEADAKAGLNDLQPDRDRQMRLACARLTQADDVLPLAHKAPVGQGQHFGLGQLGQGQEVKAVEGLEGWEARLLDVGRQTVPAAGFELLG